MPRPLLPVVLIALASAPLGGQVRPEETVDALLVRAANWLQTLEQEFAVVIVDETYSQQIGEKRYPDAPRENFRKLQSELGFLWVPEELMWVAARNVRTVDGMPIEGSSKRLQAIMEEAGVRLAFLRGLRGESSKFNIGSVYRNFNDPTFALQYLDRRSQRRFGRLETTGRLITPSRLPKNPRSRHVAKGSHAKPPSSQRSPSFLRVFAAWREIDFA